MKNLTTEQFKKAPAIVQNIYIAGFAKQFVSVKTMNEAIEQHPEYFPDEVEHRRKWALIPPEVHDSYWKEYSAIEEEFFNNAPSGKGLMQQMKASPNWRKAWEGAREKTKQLRKDLHQKYYSEYGIEWNGF